jgi:hypothetical protein
MLELDFSGGSHKHEGVAADVGCEIFDIDLAGCGGDDITHHTLPLPPPPTPPPLAPEFGDPTSSFGPQIAESSNDSLGRNDLGKLPKQADADAEMAHPLRSPYIPHPDEDSLNIDGERGSNDDVVKKKPAMRLQRRRT